MTEVEPVTGSVTRAVNVSPTLWVFVQTRWLEARLIVEPAAIVPTEPPAFEAPLETVLPLAVVLDGLGAGVVVRGVVVVREGVVVRGVVVRGVVAAGAGVAGAGAGTSVSAGCAAVSRLARFRSRLSAVSCASVSSFFSVVQAPANSANDSASGAPTRRIYLDMLLSPPNAVGVACGPSSAG